MRVLKNIIIVCGEDDSIDDVHMSGRVLNSCPYCDTSNTLIINKTIVHYTSQKVVYQTKCFKCMEVFHSNINEKSEIVNGEVFWHNEVSVKLPKH